MTHYDSKYCNAIIIYLTEGTMTLSRREIMLLSKDFKTINRAYRRKEINNTKDFWTQTYVYKQLINNESI